MKIGIVLHPNAAEDPATREAIAEAREHGRDVLPWVAWEPGQAETLCRWFVAEGVQRIVAAGGDGTVHAVAATLHEAERLDVEVGVAPYGTGNDFVRSLPEPRDLLHVLVAPTTRPVDLLCVGDQIAVNAATFGAGTRGTRNASPAAKRLVGGFAYALQALVEATDISTSYLELTSDGGNWSGDVIGAAVANGGHVAGGLCVAPDARIDDGRFRIAIVPADASLTREGFDAMFGEERSERSAVIDLVATKARLEFATETDAHVDGEHVAARAFEVRVLPGALTLVC